MAKNNTYEAELAEIRNKLDFVVEQLQEQQRHRREMEELKHELMHIGKEAMQAAVTELDELAPYVESEDLHDLMRNFLRNVRTLNSMMAQLQSAAELIDELKPLQKEIFAAVQEKLAELDEKGFFEFAGEALKIVDEILSNFTVEDVRLLRENITTILLTVKNMTQPDMLGALNNAVGFYKNMDIVVDKDVSFMRLFKEMRDPAVKRGMLFMLEFLKTMAANHQKTVVSKKADL
jgi:uncharacterized protein YjgD (DUF1641 family)